MSRKMNLDWRDVQILNIMRNDARITYKELAGKIELTESPTYTRLQNLFKNGMIKRVKADIDLESVGYQMPLVMLFKVPEGEENTLVKLVDERRLKPASSLLFSSTPNFSLNATEMTKPFGKRPSKWLELPSTISFLNTLSDVLKSHIVDFQIVTKGGNEPQGTWFIRELALEFARWLDPKFKIMSPLPTA